MVNEDGLRIKWPLSVNLGFARDIQSCFDIVRRKYMDRTCGSEGRASAASRHVPMMPMLTSKHLVFVKKAQTISKVGRSTLASRQITAFSALVTLRCGGQGSGVETSLTAMSDGRATGEGSPTAHTRLDRQKQASTPATLGNTQFLPAKTGRDDAPHGAFDRPHNLTMMVPNCEN
ncbi:hypothetical protein GE21DRAFT_1217371 [Neurospora crassa]|nr:hypothetical protein 15E6.110 [imported] - Neurospora crassa [Neurospora crassa]KHE80811.1 hypothetical protein GE21DRAFT_1217371 [Neurospora crassa]